jgi:hypothetical protein
MPKKKQADKLEGFDQSRRLLEGLYRDAENESEVLWPDMAIKRLSDLNVEIDEREKDSKEELLQEATFKNPRFDDVAYARELHHYAVDLFYETYCGKQTETGAPPLSERYLKQLVKLREEGLSYGKIAIKLGLKTSPPPELTKSTNKIRKQLKEAEARGLLPSGKRHA